MFLTDQNTWGVGSKFYSNIMKYKEKKAFDMYVFVLRYCTTNNPNFNLYQRLPNLTGQLPLFRKKQNVLSAPWESISSKLQIKVSPNHNQDYNCPPTDRSFQWPMGRGGGCSTHFKNHWFKQSFQLLYLAIWHERQVEIKRKWNHIEHVLT